MKIKIDRESCIRCGACEHICPANFKLDDEGIAEVISEEPNPDIDNALDACPTGAISVDKDEDSAAL